MSRFNFTNITLSSAADITKVMDNFNEIETHGITYNEASSLATAAGNAAKGYTDTQLGSYTRTNALGPLALKNYSYGTAAPTGGSNGDIYDQYFN